MLSNGESSIVFSWKKNRLITFGFFPRSKQKGAILSHLFVAFLIWLIGGFPSIVFALPQDGQIVEGAGSITTPTATSMQVDQNTSQMIINWQSFSTGASESVNFSQPSSSSIVLNRVIGTDPSLLLGNLTANGQVFISNGSGVFFGPGSQVDTHGLIATTMQISDQDFLDQNYNFIQDVDNPLTSVINEGTISATSYVGLLAPAVENKGTIITASLGSVDLAAGKAATLDFTGDGLIQFEVTEAVTGTVTDKDGNVLEDRVSNSGLIQADGGQVRMTAKDAGDVIRHVVNMEGTIQANTVVEKDGRVFLMGGDSGIVNVSGTISAKGDDAGEKGGTVHVLGEKVGLFDNAKVDVSGDAGGGEALIGGDYQGANENIQNSTANFIDEGASIYADALTTGDGGKIIVWADDTTRVYGTLSASAVTDDGGFIETSGKNYLDINVVPDVSSVYGIGGEWLIDPNNIEIIAGSGNTNINASSPFASTDDTAQLGVNLIITALGSGDVTITTASLGNNGQSGDITLSTALDYNGTGTNTLTLTASNDIIINNTISDSVGGGDVLNLVFDASGVIDINANIDTSGGTLTATANAGAIELGTTVTISTGTLNANSITVTANTIDLNSTTSVGTLSVSGNGTILQGTGNITVTSAMTWTGGTIGGSGLLTTNGGVTTTMATVFPVVLSRDWDNNGTINWDPTNSNDLTISSTFTLHNKSGANFNLDNSANSGAAILGGGIITNTGTTTLNSTLTPTLINPQFDNVGTVTVTQGDLQLAGIGTDTGSYTVASGHKLTFSNASGTRDLSGASVTGAGTVVFDGNGSRTVSGTYNITGGTTITGGTSNAFSGTNVTGIGALTVSGGTNTFTGTNTTLGDITVSGGDTTLSTGNTFSIANLSVSGNGSVLQGNDGITVTSAMTWTGGTIGGSGLLTTNGGVTTTMATVFPVVLSRDWDNNGTINWDPTNSNDLTISSTFTLHNKSGANFNLDNSANSGAAILGGGIITNTGTTTLNSTLTPTLINPQFDNVGTVTVTQGDLQLAGDGTDTGSYTVASSQTLTFSGGTRVIDGDISGSGTVNFSGGTLSTTSSNLSITAADVNFSVAFAAGSGTVNIIRSGGGSIGLGAASGDMTITDADLDFISAANVKIGDGTVGTITVNGISNIGISDTLTLTSGAGIVFDTGASSVNNNLAVVAGGDITQTAGLTVNGTSSFTVTGSNVITLTDTANDFTGDITLSSGSGTVEVDDIDDMSIAASTLGGTVTLKANNGLTINGNLTSNGSNAIASISLDGDANNSSDGTDNLVIAAGVTIEITGHISGFITVDATNGGITGNGALTMNAINGITINDDYSGSGTLTLNSDSTSDGIGDLTLANNVDITTGGNDIEITQADTSFGTGVTVNVVAAAVTSNFTKDVTVDGTDAAGVTAGSLTTTSTGDIIVDGVTSGELTNIAGTYSLSAGGDVTFQTTATDTNNDLTVNANNDINVKVDVTSGGKFTAKADNDSSGAGDFILDTGVTVTASAGDIDVTGFNITENGTLTASGSITRTETKPVTSTSTTTEEEEEDIDQGTNSSFLTDFTEPATSGC